MRPPLLPLVEQLTDEIETYERRNLPRLRKRSTKVRDSLKRAVYIIIANAPEADTALLTTLGNPQGVGGLSGSNDRSVGSYTWGSAVHPLVAMGLLKLTRFGSSGWAMTYTEAFRSRMNTLQTA